MGHGNLGTSTALNDAVEVMNPLSTLAVELLQGVRLLTGHLEAQGSIGRERQGYGLGVHEIRRTVASNQAPSAFEKTSLPRFLVILSEASRVSTSAIRIFRKNAPPSNDGRSTCTGCVEVSDFSVR